jgi:hypothetical protein
MDDRIPDWQTLSLFGSSPALNFAQLVSSSGTENVYQYTFTAPSTFNSTLPPQYQNIYGGNHYKILVNVLIGGQGGTSSQQVVEDLSDNNFAINPIRIEPTICGRLSTPSITVLAPNGGESYSAGQGIPVKWKTCNMPKGFLVTAQLNNSVANTGISPLRPENIVNSSTSNTTANDGQEIFYLPSAAEGATVSGLYGYGNNFRILLAMHDPSGNSWPTGNNPTDQSDNLFAINPNQTQTCHITNPSITVLSPNGGEVFQAGQQITLKWESCNIPATQPVLIVLEGNFNQGYQLNNLAGLSFEPNMLNDGIEVVTLPTLGPWPHWNLMQFGEKYKIKVVTQIGTASDLSDNLFTINDSTPPPTGEKVYIMGGNDNHVWTPFNDVWSSSEGTNWIQKTSNAQWSKRFGLTSLFYNNKIWIFGGSDGNLRNDVWSSSDGVNWTQVTANAPWAPRGWHTSLVFNNRMWIIGGASDINVGASLDDVWSSSDGVNWTQMTSNASWGNRAFHASMVFNNKMWVIGGNDYQGGPYLNDVWSSSDGVNWTQVTANAGWPARTNPTGLTYGGKIWIMGGNASFPYFNDVWSSIDGINWIQSTQHAAWSPRYGFPVVVLNNKMTIFGGVESQTVPNDSTINDVWTSSDGVTWTQMTLSAPWTARNFFTAVVNSQNLGKNAEHKTTSTPSLKETLRVGSKGEAVETLQQLLGIKVDGVYGQGTATKVKEWQAKNGLKADGAFGAKSWTKINSSN